MGVLNFVGGWKSDGATSAGEINGTLFRRGPTRTCSVRSMWPPSGDAENSADYCRIYHAAKESDTMDLGYARVSTREQDLTGQVAELQAAGCAKIFSEKASGARGDRAELARVIKRLQPGDVLVVTRLDRLARSTRDLLNVLGGFRSLKDAWCDTTTPHGVLMLTILAGLAEFERTLIKARTGEGRERAKAWCAVRATAQAFRSSAS